MTTRESGDLPFPRHILPDGGLPAEGISPLLTHPAVLSAPSRQNRLEPEMRQAMNPPKQFSAPLLTMASAIGLALVCPSVHAAEELPTIAERLPTIDVTAGTENTPASGASTQTGDVVFGEHTGVVSHIGEQSLSSNTLTLGEVINQQVGTQVRSIGGMGAHSEVSLRGSSADQVRIYLDGMPLSDGTGGVNLSDIDPAALSGVDIFRGATPIQLAGASLGGAVNLRTLDGATPSRLHLAYGALDTYKASALLAGQRGNKDTLLLLSLAGSDNDFDFVDDNGTRFNTDDDRTTPRENTQIDQQSALIKAGIDLNDTRRLDSTLQVLHKNQGIAAWHNNPDNQASLETTDWRWRGRFSSDALMRSRLNTAFDVYAGTKTETFDDRLSQIGLGAQYQRYRTQTLGSQAYLEWISDVSTSGMKVDVHQERYHQADLLDVHADDKSQRHSASLALQHAHWFADETLLLSPALRVLHYRDKYTLGDISDTHRETGVTPQLGLQYQPVPAWTLKANVARYLREPTYFELFGDRGLSTGNEELIAETGTNTDVALLYQRRTGKSWWREFSASAAVFYNQIDDMIARTYDARGIGQSQNIAAARLRGLELEAALKQRNHWHWQANLTLQEAENRASITAFEGNDLPGRERVAAYARVSAPISKNTTLVLEADYRGKRYYDTANLLPAKARTLLNAQWRYQLNSAWRFGLEVSNLTDESAEDYNGYPRPGRLWMASITYTPQTQETP